MYGLAQDGVGVASSHLFDFDTALLAGHDDVAASCPVEGDAQIQLAGDVTGRLDENLLNFLPRRARLVGDQLHAEDFVGPLPCLLRGTGQLDAASLAATAGMDLGFDNDSTTQVASDGIGLVGGGSDAPLRHDDAVVAQHLFGLELVNFHTLHTVFWGERRGYERTSPTANSRPTTGDCAVAVLFSYLGCL